MGVPSVYPHQQSRQRLFEPEAFRAVCDIAANRAIHSTLGQKMRSTGRYPIPM